MTAPSEYAIDAPVPVRRARAGRLGRLVRGGLTVIFWVLAQAVVTVPPGLVGALLGVLVGIGFLWWYVGRRDYSGERARRATLRLRPPGPVLVWVPAILLLAVGFAAGTLVLAARVLPLPSSDALKYFDSVPYGWVALSVLAVWLAPMMEEFLFRGWMQRNLERRMPAARAIMLTAFVFAAAHLELFGMPARFVVGMASGYLAFVSGSIVPSVLLHAAYNATLLAIGHVPGADDDLALVRWAHTPTILAGAAVLAAVSASGLLWTLARAAGSAAAHRAPRRSRVRAQWVADPAGGTESR